MVLFALGCDAEEVHKLSCSTSDVLDVFSDFYEGKSFKMFPLKRRVKNGLLPLSKARNSQILVSWAKLEGLFLSDLSIQECISLGYSNSIFCFSLPLSLLQPNPTT
ncbi:hypothetical protein PanWU01x14_170220 [Parasponia andersonii]|uniref:Uncharacterized protein n=1 Tax=Parasponia andersonii TaxID=3476 RepID=A0A2P5CA68_PARAD|nr:hypothetical protein PanWU01x14_170220 [Parasponia andersonii]